MKHTKIKLSLITKILFICVFSVFFSFLIKYYDGLNSGLKKMSEEMKVVIFLNEKAESGDVVTAGLESLNYFNVREYVDRETSYKRASELNPSLPRDIEVDSGYYPAYVIADGLKIKNREDFNGIIEKISGLEYVSEAAYDGKAFDLLIKNTEKLAIYEKIFSNLALIVFILFTVKAVLFIIKGRFIVFLSEIGYGAFAAVTGYAAIGIAASLSSRQFFILDWHMLFVLIPLGAVLSFMTKESNV